ncbi:MAG: hypothetical protein Q9181_005300 [Wetmoreana brouardii]
MPSKEGQASLTSTTDCFQYLDEAHREPMAPPTSTQSTPARGDDASDQGLPHDDWEAEIKTVVHEDGVVTEEMPVKFSGPDDSGASGSDVSQHMSKFYTGPESPETAVNGQNSDSVRTREEQEFKAVRKRCQHSKQGQCLFQDHSRPSLFSIRSLIEKSEIIEYEDFINLQENDWNGSCSTLEASDSAHDPCHLTVKTVAAARRPKIVNGIQGTTSCEAEFDWVESDDGMFCDAWRNWDGDALSPFNRLE